MSTRTSIRKLTHRDRSVAALKLLGGWGFSAETLQRLGGFAVVWGIFESKLEAALWALTGEEVKGVRPSTDKEPIGAQINLLTQHSAHLSNDAQAVVADAAHAATDLMEYRHAIMHGAMIPNGLGGPSFIRNPRWHGVKRSRPTHDAHVDENLLDLAIDTAWTLCRLVFTIVETAAKGSIDARLPALKQDVQRAKSQANELRHLTELVNSEKY
jgi:hypothetical protein